MKYLKPKTPGQRGMSGIEYRKFLTATEPHKPLTHGGKRFVGRNAFGRITVRHKGGGHKRLFREIDFQYNKHDIPATIETIEYDPNRGGFIGRVVYKDGERRYVLLPRSLKVGDTFIVSETAKVVPGNRLPLKNIPVGTFVYNIELKPMNGGKLARGAGNYAEIVAQDSPYTQVKMPSTEVRMILNTAWASVGEVSNPERKLVNIGKAGRSRWLGIRPTVRGSAMNPVDHPHGGGEGRSGRGRRRAISMWGKPTGKGQKSRRPKKYSNYLIISRRKVGKKRNTTQ
ncbi:50S ribosomal protein L2 [Candidatus Kaiserbacteria bacterium RIFCSPHIGHO2_02_FULL_50_9]|uniref:Large ribosomal subunit protein uL2 n=1 Tax=Candidatus Kaiserbacteria bacterium RIFCSPLOWO2_01_FULL_51_21 TaxID=1798508 RepID=A0A1F6ECJ0_9BACT|nr:MAG: 50S ribosomal protein L2 [Candidatus Kaiserbacteria bacterium RIFCSPHIGHO2_01_FULL_51_33]OGG63365.1 MAG: 50S ribosomal protein L2 [Candidatus Kaiserbacteria bacterium RIFCSPHIGHO2_02_FULL_50_9]OGG71394.1 MAG: 50S ribosomal protein L2 [Candidatus Kaiserbacteria bacterium RIFCSPLOWO2_01_FULL_51_21]